MRILLVCMFIATASAAVIPSDGLRQQSDATEIKTVTETNQFTTTAGSDGYQYKIVRRLKYRNRRDASEIASDNLSQVNEKTDNVAAEYLPPTEEIAFETAKLNEASEVAQATQDSAIKADDGYQYKTVRRLKYRQRRDVLEIASKNLLPAEESVTEAEEIEVAPNSAILGDDGYQYKTVRRLKYRQRRDVSEIAPEYLPPAEETATEAAEETEVAQDSAILADDGYQYKTVRRLKYRQRRDVSEIAPEYLPPAEETATEAAEETEVAQDSAILADDGYQYKTVRRLKYRQRRDVSEIAPEYLPPAEETATETAEETEAAQDSAILADDGYQYKTVRRLKYRQRRDVSEIAPEYLPPAEETATEAAEDTEAAQDSAILGEDGYQYKTVRRLKYRQRRDVSEISPEYLPPAEETATEAAEDTEAAQDSAILADDGYQYKTVRRLKYRQRRDVSEIAPEYLPPAEETATEAAEETEAAQDSAILGEDGYQYKTVRRLKYRQRRDVSEISPEYLPPAEETATEAAEDTEAAQDSAILADDGYQYKTVRRLKYRQRRDVSEIAPEYLPPAEETATEAAEDTEAAQDSAILGDDGYQYKTVRRLKYRQRRDVSEIAPEYLPPAEETATEAAEETEAAQDSAILGDDGYQYKTVRRLKYRQRRDVSETAPEYLPPAEETATEAAEETEAAQDSAILGEDGYQYKTVRRLKYRL